MIILLAWGIANVGPFDVMPEAYAANPNLFVSAENSDFDNYMSGPQVIEVVIIDSDIHDTNYRVGEPDVTVNGNKLRMVQAIDGDWHGYFADRNQAIVADNTVDVAGTGLDFGVICNADTNVGDRDVVTASETAGIAVGDAIVVGDPIDGIYECESITSVDNQNVLRKQKAINPSLSANVKSGQIDISPNAWPFIQLYDLPLGGNVEIKYNMREGTQKSTLTFDTVENYANLELDRTVYPAGAHVHVTITDLWLNIDPTDEDSWTFATNPTNPGVYYQVFDENGSEGSSQDPATSSNIYDYLSDLSCETNCVLTLDADAQGTGGDVIEIQDNANSIITGVSRFASTATVTGNAGLGVGSQPITITESGPNHGVFVTYDEYDISTLIITDDAPSGRSAVINYNDDRKFIQVESGAASIDIKPITDTWSSGSSITVELFDPDANKNSRVDEDLDLDDPTVIAIPVLSMGNPFTLSESNHYELVGGYYNLLSEFISETPIDPAYRLTTAVSVDVDSISEIGVITVPTNLGDTNIDQTNDVFIIDLDVTMDKLRDSINNAADDHSNDFKGYNLLNYDLRSISNDIGKFDIHLLVSNSGNGIIDTNNNNILSTDLIPIRLAHDVESKDLIPLTGEINTRLFNADISDTASIGIQYSGTRLNIPTVNAQYPIVTDFFSFGFTDAGQESIDRIANQIIRLELEERSDNSGVFLGTIEYIMLNQLNILDVDTYKLTTIGDEVTFIVNDKLTGWDAPTILYLDVNSDSVDTKVSDRQETPSHTGTVNLNPLDYNIGDTVTVTLRDADLNVDSEIVDLFTVVSTVGDPARDTIGVAGYPTFGFGPLGRLVDITFDDERWTAANTCADLNSSIANGLAASDLILVETGISTGIFTGTFQVPSHYCNTSGNVVSVATSDLEVNYIDYRDASGEIIETGDSANVRTHTGLIDLDRTVYPVPWGKVADFVVSGQTATSNNMPNNQSLFPIHLSGIADNIDASETLGNGDLTIHVSINDPDFDISASNQDVLSQDKADTNVGPVKITVSRGDHKVVLAYAGGDQARTGHIDVGDNNATHARQLGAITEVAPNSGIFEFDFNIRYTDGPASSKCPKTVNYESLNGPDGYRFDQSSGDNYCILQGDILTVEYTDPDGLSGDPNIVTASATFDLRSGVLQSDKTAYIIGSEIILTLIEPDWNLDNDATETYDLDILEWDSESAKISMGDKGGEYATFDPDPITFTETGAYSGIFQIVVKTPETLLNNNLERGEKIVLEYTDWGPSRSDYVGQKNDAINLAIYTSNFGATVSLDQKVYSWTDKVYITIDSPDDNFDSGLIDEIGKENGKIKISTRDHALDDYKLVETGTNTGIFAGEVILTGFAHDADGDENTGSNSSDGGLRGSDTHPRTGSSSNPNTGTNGHGPTDGLLESDNGDSITVSFELSTNKTMVSSALIRWNVGEVQWLESSYPASGTGVLRVVDPDMNLSPESIDSFNVDVWSDDDRDGIDLSVTETGKATGIFEGTVFFGDDTSHNLRVANGNTITASYDDNTLPKSHSTESLKILATSQIGTSVTSQIDTLTPPLKRASISALQALDSSGNVLDSVSVDQLVSVTADIQSDQTISQEFAYIIQVQNDSGRTVALAWISDSLTPEQTLKISQSWTPESTGTYTVTAFAWESLSVPSALSTPAEISITVN